MLRVSPSTKALAVLEWRASVSGGNVGGHPPFWPLAGNPRERTRLDLPAGTMAVEPYFGPNPTGPAFAAGLRWNDIITAVDGESPDLNARSFLVWFRMDHEPGDTVQLRVLNRRGTARLITYRLPQR